ncbi:uncharacterized protein LOC133176022 [Saccostrea echinata]|uniref:uncharacterized protein LOC133176022 n=1 Tax=Saccostrea echinata TaxID=191078 RepID=UPI002A8127A5|nr:uncharacterized protein LOC133176022 [Saccostrea echinata]
MSGIEEIAEPTDPRTKSFKPFSDSFVDPFRLTMSASELTCEENDSSDDEEYEPSFHLSLKLDHGVTLDESDSEEIEDDEEKFVEHAEYSCLPVIRNNDEIEQLVHDCPAMVYINQLITLAETGVPKICRVKGCEAQVHISSEVVSSAVYLRWVCTNNHEAHKWCSQPLLNRRVHSGDVLISAALLASGNNFQKISLFFKFLKLPILSVSSFIKIQRTYVTPTIEEIWKKHQNDILEEFRGKDVVVLGDGRMDSPGHSAQYCTYTFMENETHKILCLVTMDKRMTGRKSAILEKACFQKGLQFLLEKEINVVEVVTDAHVQIEALMKKDYPEIKHSFDIWHGSKNLGKKLIKVRQDKKNKKKPILQWTREIVNHFWFCSSVANTEEEFIGIWFGVIHHVVNEHEWILPYRAGAKSSCQHGPLTEERNKDWLEAGSPAHVAVREIVRDKRLIKKIPYYLNCRSTAALENFQNLILKYSSKRHSYTPPVYRARNLVAALDHNANCDREAAKRKDGSLRHQRYYSKKSGRWSAYPVREEKQYPYATDIMKLCLQNRIFDPVGMNKPVVLDVEDPRRVSETLAPVAPPPTESLVAEKKSRFLHESI